MSSGSFAKLASVTASTKRMGAVSDGLSGDLAVNIASLNCLPLDPLTQEVAQNAGLGAWTESLYTMVEGGLDILEGDVLVVGTGSFNIRAVGDWYWRPTELDTQVLVLEEIKGTGG